VTGSVNSAADGHPVRRGTFVASQLPTRGTTGYLAIVDYFRREIALGRIQAGDRLPSERKLAEQLGVARETLRQALRVLESSGHVAIHRGAAGGPVVSQAAIDPAEIRDDLLNRAESILVLADFRVAIEGAASRLAASNRTAADLATMADAQQALQLATNITESRHADTAFHLAVADAAGNALLTEAIEDARAGMFDLVDLLGFEFLRESSFDGHELIIDAIKAGDAGAATTAMELHLAATRAEFVRIVARHSSTSG
jgi:DNA-binding FadR family transcriptional regulator